MKNHSGFNEQYYFKNVLLIIWAVKQRRVGLIDLPIEVRIKVVLCSIEAYVAEKVVNVAGSRSLKYIEHEKMESRGLDEFMCVLGRGLIQENALCSRVKIGRVVQRWVLS